MSGTTLAEIYCVAGALLGLWTFARFPSLAPTKLRGAMLALVAAVGALALVPPILGYGIAQGGKAGAFLGLFGAVLPALTALFWAIACVFRAFSGLLNNRGIG